MAGVGDAQPPAQAERDQSPQAKCYDRRMTRVYMDHNATTPLAEAVADRMSAVLREEFGNPSSVHHFGQRAKAVVDEARSAVADLIGADPSEVVFTSSGTESDNFAIRGAAEALEPSGRRHLDLERHRARGGPQHLQGARPAGLADDPAAGRAPAAWSPARPCRRP